ncbi:Conserved_hypothetical protein [Hexamita inflata]|uniref:Uncharacterized protein n=1 Tax=Hexamita inflata TaxID=28002 RepID=A0AA86TWH2_9EUKA|nr:Conserved hypothetical protein [Hexamita inflata]
MCLSMCTKQESNPVWFDACMKGETWVIEDKKDVCVTMRETRKPSSVIFPGFTGLMYAAYYNRKEIAELLYAEELQYVLDQAVQIPIDRAGQLVEFPPGTSVLSIAVMRNSFAVYGFLYKKILSCYDLQGVVGFLNMNGQTTLHYFVKSATKLAFQTMVASGRFIIERELGAEGPSGINPLVYAILNGRFTFFQYFVSLANDPKLYELVRFCLRKQKGAPVIEQLISESEVLPRKKEYLQILQNFKSKLFPKCPVWLSKELNQSENTDDVENIKHTDYPDLEEIMGEKMVKNVQKKKEYKVLQVPSATNEEIVQQIDEEPLVQKRVNWQKAFTAEDENEDKIELDDVKPNQNNIEDEEDLGESRSAMFNSQYKMAQAGDMDDTETIDL